MSTVDRYAGYLDGIEEEFEMKMINDDRITHNNFINWIDHISSLKNRYVIALNITHSDRKRNRVDMRKILSNFRKDCNNVLVYAVKADKELKDV